MKTVVSFSTEKILRKICKSQPYTYLKERSKLRMKRIIKKHKGRNVQFVFPETIEINPATAGLIVGEGYIGNRQFVFANSNEKIIRDIFEFLSQFNIPSTITLEVATKNMDNDFVKKSKNKWEKAINRKIEHLRTREEFNNTTPKGTLHIRCYNSCFVRVLESIIKNIRKKVESDKDLARGYMKGILAAEGNINVKSTTTNCLYMVRISAKEEEERKHYKRCLEKLGIEIYCKDMPTIDKKDKVTKHWKTKKGRSGAVLINRWSNFYKIFSMDLLDLHEDKKRKFIKHFLYNKTTKWLLEFKELPKEWLRMMEFRDEFKLARQPSDRVKRMLGLGFLEKKKINKSKIRPIYAYKLTKKYFEFISKLLNSSPLTNSLP